ncbi:ExeA family protein, partial [Lactiplantibacillus dongliensis]
MDFLVYYGLTHNPFDKASKQVVTTIDYKEMSYRLDYLIKSLGIGLFTGRSGVGKTVILRNFAQQLSPNKYQVCYLPLTTVTVGDFYNQLAISIGIEPAFRKAAKFRQIQERISVLHDNEHRTPVFIIDEAQYLDGQIFNELMLITNFKLDGDKKCIVILSGLPLLAQTLQRPQFEAFRQRITVNYQVLGLTREEVDSYVKAKFKSAGVQENIISSEVLDTMVEHTNGSLRRLDLMITQCLILGAAQKKQQIDNELVF